MYRHTDRHSDRIYRKREKGHEEIDKHTKRQTYREVKHAHVSDSALLCEELIYINRSKLPLFTRDPPVSAVTIWVKPAWLWSHRNPSIVTTW